MDDRSIMDIVAMNGGGWIAILVLGILGDLGGGSAFGLGRRVVISAKVNSLGSSIE